MASSSSYSFSETAVLNVFCFILFFVLTMQRYYNNSYFPNCLHAFLLVFNALCFGVGAAECVGASLYLVEVGLLEWLYAVLVDGDFEAGAGVAP